MTSRDKVWVLVLCIVLAGSVIGLFSIDKNEPDEAPSERGTADATAPPPPSAPSLIDPPPSQSADTPIPTASTTPVKPPAEIPSFTPLQNARMGEYARYAALDDMHIQYRIADVDTLGALIEIEVYQAGKPLGLPARRMEKRDLDPLHREAERVKATRQMTPVEIEVAGQSWNALLYEDRWVDEDIPYVRRTWVSPEAPVLGILRMELKCEGRLEARLELINWGTAAGRPDS